MDDTMIDEDLLHALLTGVYGEAASKQFRQLYNAVSDVIEHQIDEAWNLGYEAGYEDGKKRGFSDTVAVIEKASRPPHVISMSDPEDVQIVVGRDTSRCEAR